LGSPSTSPSNVAGSLRPLRQSLTRLIRILRPQQGVRPYSWASMLLLNPSHQLGAPLHLLRLRYVQRAMPTKRSNKRRTNTNRAGTDAVGGDGIVDCSEEAWECVLGCFYWRFLLLWLVRLQVRPRCWFRFELGHTIDQREMISSLRVGVVCSKRGLRS